MPKKNTNPLHKSDPWLLRLYRKYNRLYFDGKLPQKVAIWWEPLSSSYGDCIIENGVVRIRVNPALAGWTCVAKMTVIHEMAHIAKWPNQTHDDEFDQEMQRLLTFKDIRKLL